MKIYHSILRSQVLIGILDFFLKQYIKNPVLNSFKKERNNFENSIVINSEVISYNSN
jgi:hypothetical protein